MLSGVESVFEAQEHSEGEKNGAGWEGGREGEGGTKTACIGKKRA